MAIRSGGSSIFGRNNSGSATNIKGGSGSSTFSRSYAKPAQPAQSASERGIRVLNQGPTPKLPTAEQMLRAKVEGRSDQLFNKNDVGLYQAQPVRPDQVYANTVTGGTVYASQARDPAEMEKLRQSVNMAQENVANAGVMDPQMAKYLQAAQQSGKYSPEAIAMMQTAAQGGGPSAAQAQLQSGVDQSIRAQMAMAGAGGFNPASLRGAQMRAAEMQRTAVSDAAQLRAQEQQAAQAQYLQAAMQQEQMQRQSAMQAAGLSLEQDVASQAAKQAAINAQLQGAGQYAGLGMQRALTNAELEQQAALANQQTNLAADIATQDAMLRAQLANQQTGMQSQMFNNQLGLDAWNSQQNAQLGYAGLGADLLTSLYGGESAAAEAQRNRQFQNRMADVSWGRDLLTAVLGGASKGAGEGAVIAATKSDRNAKKNIKPNDQTMAFLNALTDNSYEYKEPSKPGRAFGRQFGPMAQDLEKTEMGKTIVVEDEEGTKGVDTSRGFLLALSGLANVHNRLKALEAK